MTEQPTLVPRTWLPPRSGLHSCATLGKATPPLELNCPTFIETKCGQPQLFDNHVAGSSSVLRLYPEAGFVGFTAVVDTGNDSKSSEVECEGRRENEGKRKVEGALLGPPPPPLPGPLPQSLCGQALWLNDRKQYRGLSPWPLGWALCLSHRQLLRIA